MSCSICEHLGQQVWSYETPCILAHCQHCNAFYVLEPPTPGRLITGKDWIRVEDILPPMGRPVWLYVPSLKQPIIGLRSDYGGEGWIWAHCYSLPYHADGEWQSSDAEDDDLAPSHWMFLPEPPEVQP